MKQRMFLSVTMNYKEHNLLKAVFRDRNYI